MTWPGGGRFQSPIYIDDSSPFDDGPESSQEVQGQVSGFRARGGGLPAAHVCIGGSSKQQEVADFEGTQG